MDFTEKAKQDAEKALSELEKVIALLDDLNLQKALYNIRDNDIEGVIKRLSEPERIFSNLPSSRSGRILEKNGEPECDFSFIVCVDNIVHIVTELNNQGKIETVSGEKLKSLATDSENNYRFPPNEVIPELEKGIALFDDFNLQKALFEVEDSDIINVLDRLSAALKQRILSCLSAGRRERIVHAAECADNAEREESVILESGDNIYRVFVRLENECVIRVIATENN